jgi:hypothetical protein
LRNDWSPHAINIAVAVAVAIATAAPAVPESLKDPE